MEFVTRYRGRDVEVPSKQLAAAAAKVSPRNRAKAAQIGEQAMRKYFTSVSDELSRRHGSAWPGGTSNNSLSKRSGAGLRSIRNFIVKKIGLTVEATFRLNKYMAFHETGGWIRARSSKYLTIPLPAALNSNGTPKKPSARAWRNTFVIRSRNNNLLIVQKRGRSITPLYVLKKSVRIRARLGLRKELVSRRPAFRKEVIGKLRELNGGKRYA